MKKDLIKITALTNLHVGGGEISYGVIDKLVQRDPATSFPIIHASSLKGALKEYCEGSLAPPDLDLKNIFGNEEKPGQNKFFSAHLLTLPARSNVKPWYNATCPALIKDLIGILKNFGLSDQYNLLNKFYSIVRDISPQQFTLFTESCPAEIIIEDWTIPGILNEGWETNLEKWFGTKEDLVLLRDDLFLELCENLPVVARNRTDERNLWFEELVPRQSVFWTIHLRPENDENDIFEKVSKCHFPLHIGANATVGMGYCSVHPI